MVVFELDAVRWLTAEPCTCPMQLQRMVQLQGWALRLALDQTSVVMASVVKQLVTERPSGMSRESRGQGMDFENEIV